MEEEELWRDLQSSSTTPAGPAAHTSPPSPPPSSSYRAAAILQDFFAAPQQPATPPPLPPTVLSLSSTALLEFTSTSVARAPQMMSSGSGRHRRMIKNRESAARSRARKQAYTNELELELAQLRQENAVLIKLHQELNVRLAMTPQAPADRPGVQRCRSAPP